MPGEEAVAQQQVERGDGEVGEHDGEADGEELQEREPVAVLLRHARAHHVGAGADQRAVACG